MTAPMSKPLSTFDRIADFALDRIPAEIPASTLEAAALMTLDTLGIIAAAGPMEAGVIARQTATLLYGSSDPGHSARMMFDGRRVSLAGAAFAAATQTDNLDGHDGYNPTKGHIGVVVIPTLATLAQHLPDLTGPEALAAITVGYEVAGRAGIALHATVSDYHTSGAWNCLGVVAMAARLRGHGRETMRQALGIAEYHGPRSQMMREIATPTMLHDGSGWGAMVGMSSMILAEHGFTGAPAITMEAPEAAPFWEDLGRFWQMEHQYVKPYPICRWAHAAVDGVRAIMLEHGLSHTDIARVHVNSFHEAACLYQGLPPSTGIAQYALPFPVAAYIAYGRIGVEHISGPGLSDPLVAEIMSRITVAETERHSTRFPAGRWADVEIATTDGRVLLSGDTHARGGPEAPMSRDEVLGKYMDFAAPVLGEERAASLRDAILGLTDPGSRFADAAAHLFEPVQG
ncbi:MmgE/PrpD family protein [Ruegeria aquimaris]|uniref:MmgE/PrpD family protein n=1 Tax=Ruegeria aquimaris TaxID=2984333 RepID=A0ABT3AG02_9RHOB|nr:MmgE/PrpD family protein [Ruegeria sp. XHP0148]MCV2887492.1 MmgE/PrpD family protein [Ruegeria sp. XHP0148]